MKRAVPLLVAALMGIVPAAAGAETPADAPAATATAPNEAAMRDLFDRWQRVWEGDDALAASCVAPSFIRHDQDGEHVLTRDRYAADIKAMRAARPGLRVVVYEHAFKGDLAFFRFSYKWTDRKSGEPQSIAGLQTWRIADGKLAETWLKVRPLGSAWSDTSAQTTWTSPPPTE